MKDKTLDEEVINYFRTNRENTIPAIARRFNIPHHRADKIINQYLKTRANERKNVSSTC